MLTFVGTLLVGAVAGFADFQPLDDRGEAVMLWLARDMAPERFCSSDRVENPWLLPGPTYHAGPCCA